MILPIALVVLLTIGLVVGLAWPFLTAQAPEASISPDDVRRELDDDLHRSLTAIKEIAFDRASGYLNDEDFAVLDADERARAIELMRRRDRLDEAVHPPS